MTEDQAQYARAVSEKWAKGDVIVCMLQRRVNVPTHRAYDYENDLDTAMRAFRNNGYCIARDGVIMVWQKDQS